MDNSQSCEFFKIIQRFHAHIDDNFQLPSVIIPQLRPCQLKAVKWMVDRETNNERKCYTYFVTKKTKN